MQGLPNSSMDIALFKKITLQKKPAMSLQRKEWIKYWILRSQLGARLFHGFHVQK